MVKFTNCSLPIYKSILNSIYQLLLAVQNAKIALAGLLIVVSLAAVQYGNWVATGRDNFADMVDAEGFNTTDDS